jgi:hypothetical protein
MGHSLKQGAHSKQLGSARRIKLNWILREQKKKTGYGGMDWIYTAHGRTKIRDVSFAQSGSFNYHLHPDCETTGPSSFEFLNQSL